MKYHLKPSRIQKKPTKVTSGLHNLTMITAFHL